MNKSFYSQSFIHILSHDRRIFFLKHNFFLNVRKNVINVNLKLKNLVIMTSTKNNSFKLVYNRKGFCLRGQELYFFKYLLPGIWRVLRDGTEKFGPKMRAGMVSTFF